MKLHGGILLILSAVLALSGAKVIPSSENVSPKNASEIFCQYEHYTNDIYACFLTINNPDGRDDFVAIEGEHQPGMTNANVTMVYAVFQNTNVAPRIICQSFPNIVDYYLYDSKVQFITQDSFAACRGLIYLNLNYNDIEIIPDRVFANNENLQIVYLEFNQIRAITGAAFFGNHQISLLDLGYNNLDIYNPAIFSPLASTLNILYLNGNRFTSLPFFAFSELANLTILDVGINNFNSIPGNVFYGLTNLETLYLDRTNTRTVDPAWFMSLFSLQYLELHYNHISALPANVFNNLVNLRELSLFSNNLTFISADALGASITNLTEIFLSNNLIEAFDERIIANAQNLQLLYLANNECSNEIFFNVAGNREQVKTALQSCIRSFIGSVECNYVQTSIGYMCILAINNIVGHEFQNISGNHLEGMTNNDVIIVEALFQNTRNIPGVICSQFPNAEDIWIEESRLEVINEASFANCANLWYVNVDQNNIVSIPDNTFRNNPNLERFYAESNSISSIGNLAFQGSALKRLYLGNNLLTIFTPTPFESVGQTLEELFLYENRITSIPPGAFNNFPLLNTLYLDDNPLGRIPPNAFRGLTSLNYLTMEKCRIAALDPEWFLDLIELVDLRMDDNLLRRLPPGIFNNLRNLRVLSIDNNNIRNLNSNAFGQSLDALLQLYATSNGVRAFESDILTRARNLSTLQLNGNECVSQNFFNVQGNIADVRTALNECFRMFDGFVNCEYVRVRNDYICHLTIQNVKPRDDFFYITGNHLTGLTDANITVLDAMRQDTLIVPSIICRQFPNLVDLYIDESHVEFINEDAFEYCTNLEWLDLYGNEILAIPDFTFSNNPKLEYIYFIQNQINSIGPNAFLGTNLKMLDFDHNQLTELDRRWLQTVSGTLEILYVTFNQIRIIPANVFDNFTRLDLLSLGSNQISSLPPRVFHPLTTLRYLWLNQNRLTEINPQWFENLRQLIFLSLYENRIEDLPAFAFSNLSNLREIDVGRNQIRMLHSDPFGTAFNALTYFMTDFNIIEMIDENFFDGMTRLQYLYLFGNKCASRNYFGIQNNLNGTRLDLQRCFDNFNRAVTMNCVYMDFPDYDYTCYLTSNPNFAGNDNTEAIDGDHAQGRTNTDVLVVESFNQHMRSVPSVLCRQFPNLNQIWLSYNSIQTFRETSFSGCPNLRNLIMEANPIHVVPAGLFVANSALETLWLDSNKIFRIENGAFAGTAISSLGLAVNDLTQIELGWFDGISNNLQALYFYANFISSNVEGVFSNFPNLQVLDIGLNEGFRPSPNAFDGLTNLRELYMDDNNMRSIHPEWFASLQNLLELRLHRNNIREIPARTFEPLTNINYLVIGENPIRFIGIEAFGNHLLTNFTFLSLINAEIHAFDEELFNRASNLQQLYLFNNPCASLNFYGVHLERDSVRQEMQQCFTGFVGTMNCQFIEITGYPYMCELAINNVVGQNHFTSVPGNHVGQNSHSEVRLLEAIGQRTQNIPSILCQSFVNVDEIYMVENGIEILDETTFAGCTRLDKLTLAYNNIHTLPDNLLRMNANLGWISLDDNQISQIGENVFTGSRLDVIELYNNRLSTFNPRWFEGINTTLEVLDIKRNLITEIPENAFANLRFILGLELSHNQGLRIPSNVFDTLPRLRDLHIDDIRLRTLDAGWFRNSRTIEMLTFSHNRIRNIPDGIFENLVNLNELVIRNNTIDYLSVYQFGFNVLNITNLIADDNRINAFDIRIFEQSQNLNILYMMGNRCLDTNIRNIRDNRGDASQLLWQCFENYGIDQPDNEA